MTFEDWLSILAILICLVVVIGGGVLAGTGLEWAGDAARALAAGR